MDTDTWTNWLPPSAINFIQNGKATLEVSSAVSHKAKYSLPT